MLAHAIVNVPVRELGAFVLPVLMLEMAIVYCRQIGEEFRKLGALLKYEIPSRTTTILGVVFMVAFSILVGISQDIALIPGIVNMIVAVILETVGRTIRFPRVGWPQAIVDEPRFAYTVIAASVPIGGCRRSGGDRRPGT